LILFNSLFFLILNIHFLVLVLFIFFFFSINLFFSLLINLFLLILNDFLLIDLHSILFFRFFQSLHKFRLKILGISLFVLPIKTYSMILSFSLSVKTRVNIKRFIMFKVSG